MAAETFDLQLPDGTLLTGITAGTKISAFSSGTGGVGTYIVDTSSASTGSITITAQFIPAGSNFEINLASTDIQTTVSLYQHEIGTDAIISNTPLAISSYFETNNLGWVQGGPAQQSAEGANFWLRLERVEPDFIYQVLIMKKLFLRLNTTTLTAKL